MKNEFQILAGRKTEVLAALAKLAKKGKRFGIPPLTVTWGEEWSKPVFYPDQRLDPFTGKPKVRYHITFQKLTVEGEAPRLAGYTFLGRIEFAEAGVLVQTVPGQTVPKEYWNTDHRCEHCNMKRTRKDVFVLRSEDGKTLQVGRTCIQDFLGNDPKNVLRIFEFFREAAGMLDEEEGFFGRGMGIQCAYEPVEFLTEICTIIRRFGWMSKGAAAKSEEKTGMPETSTLDNWRTGESNDAETRQWFDKEVLAHINEGDHKLAQETLEWARGLQSSEEYLHNLNVILSFKYIAQPRHLGLAASAPAAYLRAKQREAELNEKWKKNKLSEWQGDVGKRLRNIKVKLEQCITLPATMWGQSVLYKFRDDAGNLYTAMTQARIDTNIGQDVLLTGTVKRHNEYKGVKETQLSRIALADVPAIQQPSML